MQLQANQSVWVWVLANGEGGPVGAGIVTAVGSERIGIRFPDMRALLPGCAPGSTVVLRVFDELGTYVAETTVLRVQSAPHVMILIRPPQSFTTVQRRKFFRVPAKLPVDFTITASTEPEAVGLRDPAGKTQNISAGGLWLLSALALHMDDELELRVSIPKLRAAALELELTGRVVRVGPGNPKLHITCSAGIQFVHKDQQREDALVRVMFELQRKSLA
jgi:c-di-GMP-binding flagellar brake protein YcgR